VGEEAFAPETPIYIHTGERKNVVFFPSPHFHILSEDGVWCVYTYIYIYIYIYIIYNI
jgi:hypothetical protein